MIFNYILVEDPQDESCSISLDYLEPRHFPETDNTHMQWTDQIIQGEREMANMVGETIFESLCLLIEVEENDMNMMITKLEDIRISKIGESGR